MRNEIQIWKRPVLKDLNIFLWEYWPVCWWPADSTCLDLLWRSCTQAVWSGPAIDINHSSTQYKYLFTHWYEYRVAMVTVDLSSVCFYICWIMFYYYFPSCHAQAGQQFRKGNMLEIQQATHWRSRAKQYTDWAEINICGKCKNVFWFSDSKK